MCAAQTGNHFVSSSSEQANKTGSSAPYSGFVPGSTDEFLAVALASYRSDSTQQASQVEEPVDRGPVNPLFATQKSASGAATSGEDGLFPIQDVEPLKGSKSFDTSFAGGSSKKGVIIVIIILLLVACVFAAGFFYLNYQAAQEARAQLDETIEAIVGTDTVFSQIDDAIATRITTGELDSALGLALEQSSTTQNNLSAAEELLNEASSASDKLNEIEQNAIMAAYTSISARRNLIEISRMVQSTSLALSDSYEALNAIYDLLAQADSQINTSYELYAIMMDDGDLNTQDIIDNENWALDNVRSAQDLLAGYQESIAEVDFTPLSTYLDAYVSMIEALIVVDQYAIDKDWASCNANTDAYNEAKASYLDLQASLPQTAQQYNEAYGTVADNTATYLESYEDTRAKLLEADAILEDYIGSSVGLSGALPDVSILDTHVDNAGETE